jgi:hypothetical protein
LLAWTWHDSGDATTVGVLDELGVGAAAVWLVLCDGGLVAEPMAPMMTSRTKSVIKIDQMGCRRGQARFLDGAAC